MTVEVFVDASAWIAISDVRGKYHQSAVTEFEQLVRDRRKIENAFAFDHHFNTAGFMTVPR